MNNNNIRLFVAAALPKNLKEKLLEQLHAYAHPAVRHVPAANLHLTLFFIGNVPLSQLPAISDKVRDIAQRHTDFTLTLEQTEPGPKLKNPKLVWARFKASRAFEELSQSLTAALSPIPPKHQKVVPHVTLARFRKDVPPPEGLPVTLPGQAYTLPVYEIALWQSELASPHPVYSILDTYPLQQNPQP